jgi:hypothetical protein
MQAFQVGVNRLIAVPNSLKDEAAPDKLGCLPEAYRLFRGGDFFFLRSLLNISLDIITGLFLIGESNSNSLVKQVEIHFM